MRADGSSKRARSPWTRWTPTRRFLVYKINGEPLTAAKQGYPLHELGAKAWTPK